MIGYIRILKNQIINESKINRHIMVKEQEGEAHDNVDPFIVSNKIKGFRRSSWSLLAIELLTAYIYFLQSFWAAKVMTLLVIAIITLGLYVNCHSITNHERWLSGKPLLSSHQFLREFSRSPIKLITKSFIDTGDSNETL